MIGKRLALHWKVLIGALSLQFSGGKGAIMVNPAGIGLIFAIDRPLDICRTVVNVSGDAIVAVIMNKFSGRKLVPTVFDDEVKTDH